MKLLGYFAATLACCIAVVAFYNTLEHYIYWAPSEEVSFSSSGVELSGTVVKPSSEGRFPAMILLHGSGPQMRSDPATRAVVNTLVQNGFVVLVYDKRGVGESGGEFATARYRDFVGDAVAAVDFMASRDEVKTNSIGLYTVSESGWFGPEIAHRTQQVAFIFNKVGSPLSWVDTVQWEVWNDWIADGFSESDARKLADLSMLRWVYYQSVAANPDNTRPRQRDSINRLIAQLRSDIPGAEDVLEERLAPIDIESYKRFAEKSSYDPGPFLSKSEVPMHYTFGALDINIPLEASVAALELLVAEQHKQIDITVYPDSGHSLASWKGLFNMGYASGYLQTLGKWTAKQVSKKDRSEQM